MKDRFTGITEDNELSMTNGKGIRESILEEVPEMNSCSPFKIHQKTRGSEKGSTFQVQGTKVYSKTWRKKLIDTGIYGS